MPPVELTWFTASANPEPDLESVPFLSYNRNTRPYRHLRRELSNRYGQNYKIFTTSSLYAGLEMVASGVGVGMFPKQLGNELVKQGRVVTFDPGWKLDALNFTASYIGEPRNELYSQAAQLAKSVAQEYTKS